MVYFSIASVVHFSVFIDNLVFRQSDRLPLLLLGSVSADVTQFVDNQAQADSSYTYVVFAVNASSVLSLPAIASATTFGAGEDIPGSDTIGVFWPASSGWFLRNSNTTGIADIQFSFGPMPSTWNSITGDWDGDGDDTAGLYDPATGSFFLKNTNDGSGSDLSFTFGAGGQGYIPIAGDWDGNGVDSIGLYDPASSAFLLRNANSAGDADAVFYFGAGGLGYIPIAGDWNGDGTDTVGIYLGSAGAFFLRNANEGGGADLSFSFGAVNSAPVAGDWDGDGIDTIGTYVAASGSFFLRNQNSSGNADASLSFGPAGAKPLAGDWDDSALKTAAGDDAAGDGATDGEGRTGRRGRRGRHGVDKTAVAGVGWTEQYAYDRYGNRTDGPGMVSEKNQFVRTASGPGYNYDDAGNLTKAPDGTAFDTYSYDARNMLFQAVVNNGTTTTAKFVYDGAGRRVKKIVTGGATTRFVYGAGGGLIAEYVNGTLSKEYVGGPVGMLAVVDVPAAKVNYLTPDHLGTPRIVTSNTGATATVVSRHDYKPFGAEIFADGTRRTTGMGYPVNPQSDTIRQQFTGYERDKETGLDFAQARYYGGNQGRFTTMDPLLQSGQPGDPQSWNRYTYGLNNPLRYTDPQGLAAQDPNSGGPTEEYATSTRTPITHIGPLEGPAAWSFSESVDVVDPTPSASTVAPIVPVETEVITEIGDQSRPRSSDAQFVGVTAGEGVIVGLSVGMDKYGEPYISGQIGLGASLFPVTPYYNEAYIDGPFATAPPGPGSTIDRLTGFSFVCAAASAPGMAGPGFNGFEIQAAPKTGRTVTYDELAVPGWFVGGTLTMQAFPDLPRGGYPDHSHRF